MACQVPSVIAPAMTGIESEVAVTMALTCAGMSSGPSVSWRQGRSSGAIRSSASIRSAWTSGSAFSWMTRDADVCRMKMVRRPSAAPMLPSQRCMCAVMSVKPGPRVAISRRWWLCVRCIRDRSPRTAHLQLVPAEPELKQDLTETLRALATLQWVIPCPVPRRGLERIGPSASFLWADRDSHGRRTAPKGGDGTTVPKHARAYAHSSLTRSPPPSARSPMICL